MTEVTLELPFPPRVLSPNARVHWRQKAAAAAEYREQCGWAAKEAVQRVGRLEPPVHADVTFTLPSRRRRDADNLMAMLKPAWDGLVDGGLLQDDRVGMFELGQPKVRYDHELYAPAVTVVLRCSAGR